MATTTTPADGSGKKVRKPYTITKSRESWTQEEHDKFLEALQLFDRDGKKIEDFVGSKTVIQVLLLMRNPTVNLSSPDFEPIRNFLSSYDINTKTVEVTADIDAKKLINDLACQTA